MKFGVGREKRGSGGGKGAGHNFSEVEKATSEKLGFFRKTTFEKFFFFF